MNMAASAGRDSSGCRPPWVAVSQIKTSTVPTTEFKTIATTHLATRWVDDPMRPSAQSGRVDQGRAGGACFSVARRRLGVAESANTPAPIESRLIPPQKRHGSHSVKNPFRLACEGSAGSYTTSTGVPARGEKAEAKLPRKRCVLPSGVSKL
jgi:hypothetical protein